jgi:ABC-type phosphate transport system auxiliary subunit
MATEDAIYKFKLSNVLNRIQEIQQKLGKIDTQQEIEEVTNLLIEQINLEKAKVQIANKLRITIL